MPKNNPRRFALTPAFIEHIHDFLVSRLMPGTEPVGSGEYRDWSLLESAAYRPFHSFGDVEVYPSLPEKGAALFHSLIANHPFHNGNKRTAIIALNLFVEANGWHLTVSSNAMYGLAKYTASYREHGTAHEEAFKFIKQVIQRNSISFRRLGTLPGTSELRRNLSIGRKYLRLSPLNHPQPF